MIAILAAFAVLILLSVPVATAWRHQRRAIENMRDLDRRRGEGTL